MIPSVFGRPLIGLRRLRSAALIALGLAALAACDSVEERVADHQGAGETLVAEGEPAKAALEFRNALQLDQDFVPARFELAKILEQEGDLKGAAGHFLKVVELEPEHVGARVKLAQIMLLAGRIDEALTHSEAAYKAAPENVGALIARANVALRLDNPEMALDSAQAARRLAPNDPAVGVTLSAYHLRAGDPQAALETVERYLARHERDLALNVAKLRILSRLEDEAAIGAHLAELVELYPGEPRFRRSLIDWRLSQGDVTGAEADFRALADADPGATPATLDLVRFLIRAEGLQAGRDELASRIEAADENRFALQAALATLDYRNDRPGEAKALLREIVAAGGENADDARLRLARFLAAEGDAEEAAALAEEALANDPNNVDALALRAAFRIEQDDLEGAILDLRTALNESPGTPRLLALIAMAYERDGSTELASESFASAMRESEYAPDMVARYARFLRRTDQIETLEIMLTEAVRRRPEARSILTALARARLRLQKWKGAEAIAARLRRLEEGDETADRVAAAALSGQERFDESIEILRELAASGDSADSAMAGLIDVYLRSGQIEEAKSFLNSVLESDPRNIQALLLQGALSMQAGEAGAAKERFRAVIEAAPENPAGYRALAQLHLQQGRQAAAEETLAEGVERAADPSSLRLLKAMAHERAGEIDAAIAEYSTLYETNPDSLVVANNLASLISDHRSEEPESLDLAYAAAKRLRASDAPAIQDTYGWVLYLKGNYEGALRALRPAVEALPRNPWVQFHAGMAYAKLGQADEARAHLETALELAAGAPFPKTELIRETLSGLSPADRG